MTRIKCLLSIGLLLAPMILRASDSMLTVLEDARMEEISRQHSGKTALVFTESRENPIRRVHGIPSGWASQLGRAEPAFHGQARPGEFFVFQIGVYALDELGPLRLTFAPLQGSAGTIPAGAMRCLSLAGINDRGQPFAKELQVKRGDLQALWVGVEVPLTAKGSYTGSARLQVALDRSLPIKITLEIEGSVLSDHGDSVAKNLSRLRWLDSDAGSQAVLTKPFPALETGLRLVKVLGRDLVLGEDGLPAQIVSHFSASNTRLLPTGRGVLEHPMSFVVETRTGKAAWHSTFGRWEHTDLEARWTARNESEGLRADVSGRLDYTGSGEIQVRLTTDRDLELQDTRLEVPFREEAAQYFMGLNQRGGRRPNEVRWKWEVAKRQDCFWLGEVNAGLMLRFKDAEYLRPTVNIYYAFRPLRLPKSWGNEGRGGVEVEPAGDQRVLARAFSGPRTLRKGDSLDFIFELYLTPFRIVDTEKQWAVRFTHLGGANPRPMDDAVATADTRGGPNVVNIHHASYYCPYINYPYSDDSFAAFCGLVQRAHARDVKLRVYYTTREITQNMPELFPLHSLNGEVILPGPGQAARTLLHPQGPHAWLTENLKEDFVPAWEAKVGAPYADLDLSVITTPDSRWNNFYLEGLRWLVEKSDFDGMYIDDTALNAVSLRRARRILDTRPGRYIDLHTWNHFNGWAGFANNLTIYLEILPYLDRLWIGEGFSANEAPWDYWLVEMSGLPFGLMSEMLDGPNAWRGMVFGETGRLPWSGDPRGLWKVWDEYGLAGTEMSGFFDPDCPVKTDHPEVKVTVYRKPGRAFLTIGSWAKETVDLKLRIDWTALGLNASRVELHAPAIDRLQPERRWRPDETLPVKPGQGWFLVLSEQEPQRSIQVELPNQDQNVIKTSWPGIGCWFWGADEFKPEGYKRFIDLHEKHSAFRLLTTSIRHPVEVTDPKVHDQIKAAAGYARAHDLAIVMDLDVRLARQAYLDRYPDEMQEIVRLREVALSDQGEASLAVEAINLGDHYTFAARGYDSLSGRLLRAYSYRTGPQGADPDSVQDITARCRVVQADDKGVKVTLPLTAEDQGRTACLLAAFTLLTPDVFAPHLTAFERGLIEQYADVPLAGACKDEWGFPGRFGPQTDDLYFSRAMAEAYVQRRPGRDLVRDLLLMVKPEQGRERERAAAINHYMEMNWQRNGQVETEFYQSVKKVFGPTALSATHPTWFPFLNREEIFKNGLDWWVAKRDLAQTDEATPFCARTALAKKWSSPLWYNMYYDGDPGVYAVDIWRHALGGGRMNFHPLWPHPREKLTTSLLSGHLLQADCRIRLLNYISTAPIDCPVAVVFGHPAALNWAGAGFAEVGLDLCNEFWKEGYYADLIPSSEIRNGALKIGSDGRVWYGPQPYAAVVLVQPQYERPLVAEFFQQAAKPGKTALFRLGQWTMDFEGMAFDGDLALPVEMKAVEVSVCATRILAHLRTAGIEPQTQCTLHQVAGFPASMMPKASGQCRLLDGTVILASGEKEILGDPIRKSLRISGHEVVFDAVGVAAVRFDPAGKVAAMAAGGLKTFTAGDLALELAERADVALWRDSTGQWQGILQGYGGPVPDPLNQLTPNWTRLRLPVPMN